MRMCIKVVLVCVNQASKNFHSSKMLDLKKKLQCLFQFIWKSVHYATQSDIVVVVVVCYKGNHACLFLECVCSFVSLRFVFSFCSFFLSFSLDNFLINFVFSCSADADCAHLVLTTSFHLHFYFVTLRHGSLSFHYIRIFCVCALCKCLCSMPSMCKLFLCERAAWWFFHFKFSFHICLIWFGLFYGPHPYAITSSSLSNINTHVYHSRSSISIKIRYTHVGREREKPMREIPLPCWIHFWSSF